MKRLKDVLMVLVGISFLMFAIGRLSYAQPNIPREKIPSDIPSDVREQFEKLYSSDPVERALGALNLGTVGKEAVPAIPFLIGMLGDDAGLIWTPRGSRFGEQTSPGLEAAKALVKIGEPAVEPLIAALKNKDAGVRGGAARVLGEIKDPRVVELLIAALKDKDWNIRERMVKALGDTKGPHAVEPLIEALKKDEEWLVRRSAAEALGEIKDPRAVEPLIEALKDKDSYLRSNAAKALGEIKDPRGVEPLIEALKDKEWNVRENVAEALGEIKDPRAIEPLIAALEDGDRGVRDRATWVLRNITGQGFGEDPAKWQAWWEENKGKFQK